MRLDSMRARMTAAFACCIGVMMLLVCTGLTWYANHLAERNADTLMLAMLERVKHELTTEGEQAELTDELNELHDENLALLIVNPNGRIVRRSAGRVPLWPHVHDGGWRIVGAHAGGNTIVIGMNWAKTASALKARTLALLFVSLCVVVASGVGAWVLVGRTLSPIGALSRQAQVASTESLHVQLNAPSRDREVVELVGTLNGLLARLSDAAASKGRFYASASHELRTPLQALSGHLEVARQRDRTGAEYRAAIDEAYRQTRRLTSLVQDLLMLNQLEASPAPPPKEPVNVTDVCDRALGHYRALCDERSLRVRADLHTDLEVIAPPTHVNMLVRNLVENALKYATPGGIVCIEPVSGPFGSRLDLFNECLPLRPEILQQLCEPFYRPDVARDSETGGNGLGLAICKAIALANGWTLTLCAEGSGLRVSVAFTAPAR